MACPWATALMARERAENVCGTLAYVAPEALVAGRGLHSSTFQLKLSRF
jgi:hypothetical protein